MDDLKIEYRSPDTLTPFANNPRTHSDEQIAQIVASIKKFGFVNPIKVDQQGVVIAGHGRLGSVVFEDQPILNLIRMKKPQGGEPVTPVGIAGEIPNSDIVLLNGSIDSPIRYMPALSEAYEDPFADTLNSYGALVTTSAIWLSQGNPNVKEFPGSIRRSLELLNVAPNASNNNKLAHDFSPAYNERFGARGDMGRAITLNAQEGIVLANQRMLASAAEYYWEVEFQYIEPSDQFPTVAYACVM